MLLFNSLVFGAFVGMLTDYWLGRGGVQDDLRLIVSVVVGVIVGVLVFVGTITYF